jgi:DNA polymerase-4
MTARICCLDLDTFFVSVERLLDPSLVGRPVVVGGRPGSRGVVTSASYEVRALGVRSGMSMAEATRLAPDACFVPTRHGVYSPYAKRVREVLERWCPVVRTASIDEFFLDFSGCESMYRRPGDADADATIARVVREMRDAIQREVDLPSSAGIGSTRAVAKMASGRAKPAGVLMVRVGGERAFAAPLPVRKYPGIGPVAEQRLLAGGITTLGELLAIPAEDARFGDLAESVREGLDGRASGLPERDRPAFHELDDVHTTDGSISNERTFFADVGDLRVVRNELRSLVERVAWRLRRRNARARTVTLRLRYADFTTLTRARSTHPVSSEREILAVVTELLNEAWTRRMRIRLLGVALSRMEGPDPQLPLPWPAPARPSAGRAIDSVRERFGYDAIRLGVAGERREWVA